MKYASYLFIMMMLVGLASLFIIKRPDGKPYLSVDMIFGKAQQEANALLDKSKRELNDAVNSAKGMMDGEAPSASQATIYKWQDAKGNWHYSDRPNTRVNSQVHTLDPTKITIMAAENTDILNEKTQNADGLEGKGGINSMSPNEVKKLVQDAQNVQKLMDQRAKQLDDT